MENKLLHPNQTAFEKIKRLDGNNHECWSARELSKVLEYSEFRHFRPVVEKAKEACKNSGYRAPDHIKDVLDMVVIA